MSGHPRTSWVVWEEDGQYPNLIIELLSESTENVDRGIKKQLYQDRFRTPEYFWFAPDSLEFMGYRLVGHKYQEIPLTNTNKRWSEELELYLGVKEGKLRYFTPDGELVPTPRKLLYRKSRSLNKKLSAPNKKNIELTRKLSAPNKKNVELTRKLSAPNKKNIELTRKLSVPNKKNIEQIP